MSRLHLMLLVIVVAFFAWSSIGPFDRFTWWLEVAPVLLAAPVIFATYRRFRLTDLAYTLIAIHAVILIVGGHYTYAQMPLFNWLRDGFDLARNHYDRVGHFAQGFIPAIIARELLIRTSPLSPGKWMFTIVTSICLAISALYELIEWAAAALTGTAAEAFLGTQGDVWDTQKDMALCLVGAVTAQLLLGHWHNRQIWRRAQPDRGLSG